VDGPAVWFLGLYERLSTYSWRRRGEELHGESRASTLSSERVEIVERGNCIESRHSFNNGHEKWLRRKGDVSESDTRKREREKRERKERERIGSQGRTAPQAY